MLCRFVEDYEHVVLSGMAHLYSGLSIGIVGGCGACGWMLAFCSDGSRPPGARFKAWVQALGPLWTSSSGRGDEVLSEAPYGEGPIWRAGEGLASPHPRLSARQHFSTSARRLQAARLRGGKRWGIFHRRHHKPTGFAPQKPEMLIYSNISAAVLV
jgi:hypothetical protein